MRTIGAKVNDASTGTAAASTLFSVTGAVAPAHVNGGWVGRWSAPTHSGGRGFRPVRASQNIECAESVGYRRFPHSRFRRWRVLSGKCHRRTGAAEHLTPSPYKPAVQSRHEPRAHSSQ